MCGVRCRRPQVAQIEPLTGEVAHQGFRTGIGEHAQGLLLEHRRIPEPPALGKFE